MIRSWKMASVRAKADEMLLDDETFAFKPTERFADRRVGDGEFLDQVVDRDARARRDLQRHELVEDHFVDVADQAVGPRYLGRAR